MYSKHSYKTIKIRLNKFQDVGGITYKVEIQYHTDRMKTNIITGNYGKLNLKKHWLF